MAPDIQWRMTIMWTYRATTNPTICDPTNYTHPVPNRAVEATMNFLISHLSHLFWKARFLYRLSRGTRFFSLSFTSKAHSLQALSTTGITISTTSKCTKCVLFFEIQLFSVVTLRTTLSTAWFTWTCVRIAICCNTLTIPFHKRLTAFPKQFRSPRCTLIAPFSWQSSKANKSPRKVVFRFASCTILPRQALGHRFQLFPF